MGLLQAIPMPQLRAINIERSMLLALLTSWGRLQEGNI